MDSSHCTYLTEQQRQPLLSSSHSSYSSPAWLTASDFSRALPAGGGWERSIRIQLADTKLVIYQVYNIAVYFARIAISEMVGIHTGFLTTSTTLSKIEKLAKPAVCLFNINAKLWYFKKECNLKIYVDANMTPVAVPEFVSELWILSNKSHLWAVCSLGKVATMLPSCGKLRE